jgi:hypothetical protein
VSFTYSCILSHIGAKTQVGFPSYQTIANKCGMTRRKAIECVADLVFLEFVGKKACWHKDGDQDTNNYYVLDMPDIKDVIAKLLRDDVEIPKGREWIVKNLQEYSTATMTKRDYEKLVGERNTGLDAGGVVNEIHHPSEYSSLPVVNTVHQGGEYGSPKTDIVNKTNIKQTYLHTAKSENESQATSLDSTAKGVASDSPRETGNNSEGANLIWGSLLVSETEKMLISNELTKLLDTNLAQFVVDEVTAKYAAGKIKTSLTVYTKGLVNKANKGEFTPTNNLQLKRSEKAQRAIAAKSNTPAPNKPKDIVAAHTVIASLKQTIAAGGRRSLKKTPEEQAEIDKALAEIATRKK